MGEWAVGLALGLLAASPAPAEEFAFAAPDGAKAVVARVIQADEPGKSASYALELEGKERSERSVIMESKPGPQLPRVTIIIPRITKFHFLADRKRGTERRNSFFCPSFSVSCILKDCGARQYKWSPDSRFFAVLKDYGKEQFVSVYDTSSKKLVEKELGTSEIQAGITRKIVEFLRKKSPDEQSYDRNRVEEDVTWSGDGTLTLKVSGFSLSPEEIGYKGVYEVNLNTGKAVEKSWEIQYLKDK